MRNFIAFMIMIAVITSFLSYHNISSQVKQTATSSEVIMNNEINAFLDKVSDSGAISAKDYTSLMSGIMATGGTFNINITVTRLYPIPDPSEPGSYVLDYKPAYGWSTGTGGFPADYVDPNWQSSNGSPAPRGVQYLVKNDNVQINIIQVDAMDYQRTMISRMNHGSNLGLWSRSKAVRDTGNSIVGNQQDPIN